MNIEAQRPLVLGEGERGGLPPWTYFNEEFLELEKTELFRKCWQIACHVSDVPQAGDYRCFDIVGERALIVRGKDMQVRAFHNVCRHRGSRVVADQEGSCKSALVCPFHGWSFNLDGTLKAVPRSRTFPNLDPKEMGLIPLEFEIWNGLVFVRFQESDQPSVATLLSRFEGELAPYRMAECVPFGKQWSDTIKANWKSVRDVDNEGYHVPIAHPGLEDLYGKNYIDERYDAPVNRAIGIFNDDPGRRWSVRHYRKILPRAEHLNDDAQNRWVYYGLFPNMVFMVYPDCIGYYQEFPLAVDLTLQVGAYYALPDDRREMKLARYLSTRIDRDTGAEDAQLIEWSSEAMSSSGFTDLMLSDIEAGVRDYHDQVRKTLPVSTIWDQPERGEVAPLNETLLVKRGRRDWTC